MIESAVCACAVGSAGRAQGKAQDEEDRSMKEAAGLADTPCARGGEEWHIGICGSLLAGSKKKGS